MKKKKKKKNKNSQHKLKFKNNKNVKPIFNHQMYYLYIIQLQQIKKIRTMILNQNIYKINKILNYKKLKNNKNKLIIIIIKIKVKKLYKTKENYKSQIKMKYIRKIITNKKNKQNNK